MHLHSVAIVAIVVLVSACIPLFFLALLRIGSKNEDAIRGEFLGKLPRSQRIRYRKLFLNF